MRALIFTRLSVAEGGQLIVKFSSCLFLRRPAQFPFYAPVGTS